MKKNLLKITLAALVAVAGIGIATNAHADSRKVIDISEWQGTISKTQATRLKSEFQGVVLRTQYGSTYKDKVFARNAATLESVGMKYGVYSYSLYWNASDAKQEARDLHARAPHAVFYANDAEQYTVTSGSYAAATKAWGAEMQKLTSKPVVLYSGNYFYGRYIGSRTNYDALWIAAYGSNPTYTNDMHQYTDKLYSSSLGLSVDGNHNLSTKMKSYFSGNTANDSKFTAGGQRVNDVVRVAKGATFYNSTAKIADSVAGQNLRIKQVKAANVGKSKQVVLVYNGSTPIGWVKAQDVTAYYHAASVKKLKVTNSAGIYTYLHGKRANHYKKGAVLKVSKFTTNANGLYRAVHAGHTTTFTTNKNFVKAVG